MLRNLNVLHGAVPASGFPKTAILPGFLKPTVLVHGSALLLKIYLRKQRGGDEKHKQQILLSLKEIAEQVIAENPTLKQQNPDVFKVSEISVRVYERLSSIKTSRFERLKLTGYAISFVGSAAFFLFAAVAAIGTALVRPHLVLPIVISWTALSLLLAGMWYCFALPAERFYRRCASEFEKAFSEEKKE